MGFIIVLITGAETTAISTKRLFVLPVSGLQRPHCFQEQMTRLEITFETLSTRFVRQVHVNR